MWGSENHNQSSIKLRVRLSNHKCTLAHSRTADTMLRVLNLRICAEALEFKQWMCLREVHHLSEQGTWPKRPLQRSSTSNNVTGRQSLSSTKLIPGKTATRAARTKVPAHVGCTWCSPVVAEMGKRRSSDFSLWGPMSCRRLCHHLAAAGQRGMEGSCLCALPGFDCRPWHTPCESLAGIHTDAVCIQRWPPSAGVQPLL